MIPLRDSEASHRLTLTNTCLIVANIAVFAFEVHAARNAEPLFARFAMVPARITHVATRSGYRLDAVATLVTSLFLHAGLLHIAGNMLYLFIFGPAVEERLGHFRFLWFYLLSGIAAGLAMIAMGPDSRVAVIGASGAIAGVLGAYFVLYPRGRIMTILPLFIFVEFIEIPAVFYLLFWFALQLWAGISAGAQGPFVGGVAWWAHVGGFLFGVAIGPLVAHHGAKSIRRKH
jgi:membrane associated rhomboid family serine protease